MFLWTHCFHRCQSPAPMRSAIEQFFKYFCNEITDDGLVRMLRVIKRNLKPAIHHNAEDSDHDDNEDQDFLGAEEDEEIDEADTGETGVRDEQTDESEGVVRVGEVEENSLTLPTTLMEEWTMMQCFKLSCPNFQRWKISEWD